MNIKLFLILISMAALTAVSYAALSLATENKGAENITLEGGTRGHVPFPHRQHQEKLVDCRICHSVFDQERGVIQKLKTEGALKKKHVMNKLCTKCHREKKKAGQPTGPTTCKKCHVK